MGTFLGKGKEPGDIPGKPGDRPDPRDEPGDEPRGSGALVCVGGFCREPEQNKAYPDASRAVCRGKAVGDSCESGVEPAHECDRNLDCPAGHKCVKDVNTGLRHCVPRGPGDGDCPYGDWFTHFPKTGPCPEGYILVSRRGKGWDGYKPGADGRCECDSYYNSGQDGDGLGEYEYPDWMQEWMSKLSTRGQWLLDPSHYGFSQEWMDKSFGQGFDKVRQAGRGSREAVQGVLGSQGMLGTGTETKAMGQTAWNTEKNVGDLMRDVFLRGEEQRKSDVRDYTGLSNQLFAGGLGFEQLLEAINSGRRGEGQAALMMLMQLLNTLKW